MATLQEQIAALNDAIASGEKQVALGAQQVTYRSISEMIVARNDLETRLAKEEGQTKSKITKLYHAGRGY